MESDHHTDVRSNPRQAYLRYAPTTMRSRIIESSHCEVTSHMWPYLPPANEVSGKVIFLHLFVILFTGGVPVTPRDQVPPPRPGTPIQDQVHPPGPGTPPGTRYTPWCRACWEIRSTRRQYASYWNAILFSMIYLYF